MLDRLAVGKVAYEMLPELDKLGITGNLPESPVSLERG
jgi:hypothetical protein